MFLPNVFLAKVGFPGRLYNLGVAIGPVTPDDRL